MVSEHEREICLRQAVLACAHIPLPPAALSRRTHTWYLRGSMRPAKVSTVLHGSSTSWLAAWSRVHIRYNELDRSSIRCTVSIVIDCQCSSASICCSRLDCTVPSRLLGRYDSCDLPDDSVTATKQDLTVTLERSKAMYNQGRKRDDMKRFLILQTPFSQASRPSGTSIHASSLTLSVLQRMI